jgi:predicted chitinase
LSSKLLQQIFPFESSEKNESKRNKIESTVAQTRNQLLPYINKYLNEFEMGCIERIYFFSQVAEETGNLENLTEIDNKQTYKGRGLLQITTKDMYCKFQDFCVERGDNIDCVNHPELLEQPKYAVLSAFWYWQANNLKKYCIDLSEDNLLKISKIINCGSITSNCNQNDQKEPCLTCTPNGWDTRKFEFNRLKNTFSCK